MFKKMSLHFEEKMKLKEDNLDERMGERETIAFINGIAKYAGLI
jgi:hypothetical protein